MKKLIISIFLIISLYFLLINPALTFIGGKHTIILLYPLLAFLVNKRFRETIELHIGLFIAWSLLFIYIVFRTLIGGIPDYLYDQLGILFDIIVSFIIIRIAIINKIDLIKMLLIMCAIAGVISCICLFFPSFNDYTKNIQIITNEYLMDNTFRGFGIGEGLTFQYGVILGSICAIGICYINDYKWFVLFVPIVAVAVLINARTGFIPIAISFILFLFVHRNLNNYVYLIAFIGALIIIWVNYIEKLVPEDTLIWALGFFEEIGEGREGGTISTLLSMSVWPEGIEEWILGKGYSVFIPPRGPRTDIGYMIEICYGGLIYVFLLCLLLWRLIKPAYRLMPQLLFWTFFISMLFENYKGELFSRNSAFTFLLLLMMYYPHTNISLQCNVMEKHGVD